jgi:hypothetical protein
MEVETGDLFPGNINELEGSSTVEANRQRPVSKGSHETEDWPIELGEVTDFDAGKIYPVTYLVVSYDDIFGFTTGLDSAPIITRPALRRTHPAASPTTARTITRNLSRTGENLVGETQR